MADLLTHTIMQGGIQPGAKPERVIIMLHGIGQNPSYMEEAAKACSDRMPNTLVIMAEAPLKMNYSPEKTARIREKFDPNFDPDKARSWFRTETTQWPELMLRVAFNKVQVVHDINKLADHYRDKYGLQDKDLAFFGMSQGAAISLYAVTARKEPVAAVVSHTGMFFGFSRTKSKPDVLMITGDKDEYLCDNKSKMKGFFVRPENSLRRLKRRKLPVTEIHLAELAHEMTTESIAVAANYLANAFKVQAPANDVTVKETPTPKALAM
ncbi:MAG: alpha/beta hydrolase [Alphaproteobacteria bacterium]